MVLTEISLSFFTEDNLIINFFLFISDVCLFLVWNISSETVTYHYYLEFKSFKHKNVEYKFVSLDTTYEEEIQCTSWFPSI